MLHVTTAPVEEKKIEGQFKYDKNICKTSSLYLNIITDNYKMSPGRYTILFVYTF